jgi:hypothetical protein
MTYQLLWRFFLHISFCIHIYNMKCLFFYGLLKLNIKTFKALFVPSFVRALSGFTSTPRVL